MKRKLSGEHLLELACAIFVVLAAVFIPYYLGGMSLHGYKAITPPQITPNPSADYFLIMEHTDPFWNGTFAQWANGWLRLLIFMVAIVIILIISAVFWYLFDWLFPEIEPHKTCTPEKDGDSNDC